MKVYIVNDSWACGKTGNRRILGVFAKEEDADKYLEGTASGFMDYEGFREETGYRIRVDAHEVVE